MSNICTGNSPSVYTATTSSTEMLGANASRNGLWIQNIGNKKVYIAFGSNAAEVAKGIRINKDERVQFGSDMMPLSAINCIAETGSHDLIYQEFQ